jgi:hypothetical protein
MALEYIRFDEGMSVVELDKLFRSGEMQKAAQFKEDVRVSSKAKAEGMGRRISAYENAERDVSFGTQRRYAVLTGTNNSVIHFISLLYAFLRCAAAAGDPAVRAAQLAEALTTARKLKSLATAAEAMVKNAESSGLLDTLAHDAWTSAQERRRHTAAVMRPLFEAYRKDPAA